ncbi:MAG TPA: hypothetical protein VN914_21630 [Polyangia bacterium]|nr:hypothetical protein [Polyangia bacterium]
MSGGRSELARKARLTVVGTVAEVHDRTATVVVDRAPQGVPLNLRAGSAVRVRLAGGEKVAAGETVVFYIRSWEVGDDIVLASLGHSSPPEGEREDRAAEPADDADLVVSGVVSTVAPAPREAHQPVTEHAPDWHEAVLQVTHAHKGVPAAKEVIVRFPASTDVRWQNTPKLSPGQSGTFVLKRDPSSRSVYSAVQTMPDRPARAPAPSGRARRRRGRP